MSLSDVAKKLVRTPVVSPAEKQPSVTTKPLSTKEFNEAVTEGMQYIVAALPATPLLRALCGAERAGDGAACDAFLAPLLSFVESCRGAPEPKGLSDPAKFVLRTLLTHNSGALRKAKSNLVNNTSDTERKKKATEKKNKEKKALEDAANDVGLAPEMQAPQTRLQAFNGDVVLEWVKDCPPSVLAVLKQAASMAAAGVAFELHIVTTERSDEVSGESANTKMEELETA